MVFHLGKREHQNSVGVVGDAQHGHSNTPKQHLWLGPSAGMISASFLLCCDCCSSSDTYPSQSHIAKGYFRPNQGLLSTFRLVFSGANLY